MSEYWDVEDLHRRVHELESEQKQLKVLRADVQQGFSQAHDFVQERFAEMNVRFEQVNGRLDRIEATQANQGKMLQEQSELLKQILAELKKGR